MAKRQKRDAEADLHLEEAVEEAARSFKEAFEKARRESKRGTASRKLADFKGSTIFPMREAAG